ncbi:MAG: dihydroxy-acid dehydratase [Deltaproteobacteria bacterium]|nr:dihydroxy-acid dehydratase [Deltaproteobacteria bacterium]
MNLKKHSRVFSDDDPLSMVRRSMLYAGGWTYEEIKRPFIAVVNTYNEMHPGHMHLKTLAERVKAGVRTAGGLPTEFYTLSLCDGLANGHEGMKFVLPSRQVIADSVELGLRGHCYDAAVLIGSCDKILPALLIAAARVNIPAIIVTGGPMPAGYWARERVKASVSNFGQMVQKVYSGGLSKEIREEALASFYPCAGACWGMGTANTMACLCEALGMSLPGDGTAPGVMAKKARLAEQAGEKIMELLAQGITPAKIMTRESLENALKVNLAIGGSLNTVLHLPALAHELGMKIDYADFDRLSREIPHLTNVEPAGPYSVIELDEVGGIPGVMKSLEDLLNGTALTVTGKTLSQNLEKADIFSPEVIRPRTNPVHPYGGIAVLKGNLAEGGAVIKQVAVKKELWRFNGRARVFNSEEEALADLGGGGIKKGDVVVVRYEGPKGGPGMREMAFLRIALKIAGMAETNYIVTDGRFSGYSDGPSIGYLSPEAAEGGTIALVQDGDGIEIDIENRKLELKVSDDELKQRREKLVHPPKKYPRGYLDIYARMVSSAAQGAVMRD